MVQQQYFVITFKNMFTHSITDVIVPRIYKNTLLCSHKKYLTLHLLKSFTEKNIL